MRVKLKPLTVELAREVSGTVAVTIALTLSAVIGFAALATEAAGWYLAKRTMRRGFRGLQRRHGQGRRGAGGSL